MAIDWTNLYKKHKGKWVALAKDEVTVLGVGATAKEAIVNATKKSAETPFLTRVPETLAAYVGVV
jgi:hypothetical protein